MYIQYMMKCIEGDHFLITLIMKLSWVFWFTSQFLFDGYGHVEVVLHVLSWKCHADQCSTVHVPLSGLF